MPTVTVDYFGFSGTGPTVKEAKQDAGRKIAKLQQGYWTPKIREWRGYAILIVRTLQGWEKVFIQHPGEPLRVGSSCCGFETDKEAIEAAERHIADVAWTPADPIDAFPVWFGTDANREHAEMRRQIIAGRKWQMNMQHLTSSGTEQEDARHMIAGMMPLPETLAPLPYPEAR